ncbi:hypothetical protein Hanom_Chr01g00030021 [Helianthus anomalus]
MKSQQYGQPRNLCKVQHCCCKRWEILNFVLLEYTKSALKMFKGQIWMLIESQSHNMGQLDA